MAFLERGGLRERGVLRVESVIDRARAAPSSNDPTLRLSWVRDEDAADCPDVHAVEERARRWLVRDPFVPSAPATAEILLTRHEGVLTAKVRVHAASGASSASV